MSVVGVAREGQYSVSCDWGRWMKPSELGQLDSELYLIFHCMVKQLSWTYGGELPFALTHVNSMDFAVLLGVSANCSLCVYTTTKVQHCMLQGCTVQISEKASCAVCSSLWVMIHPAWDLVLKGSDWVLRELAATAQEDNWLWLPLIFYTHVGAAPLSVTWVLALYGYLRAMLYFKV